MAIIVSLVLVAVAAVCTADRVTLEAQIPVGNAPNWVRLNKSAKNDKVNAHFFMTHDEAAMEQLERTWTDVSNPKHEDYGKYLSLEELTELVQVPQENLDSVVQWLLESGVPEDSIEIVRTRDIIDVTTTADVAATLFGGDFYQFSHTNENVTISRMTSSYSLPAHVADVVDLVANIVHFPKMPSPIIVDEDDEDEVPEAWPAGCGAVCKTYATPQVLKQRYNVDSWIEVGHAKGRMAVSEFQNVYYDQLDFLKMKQACKLPFGPFVNQTIGKNSPTPCKQIQGGNCVEALLDVEYIKGLAGGIPLTDIYNADYSLLTWAKQLDNLADIPAIHSVSYGNDEVQQTSREFMYSCNAEFMKVGVRGATIFFASGDQGVWGRTGPIGIPKRFHPDFPADSPYITAVGGTDFVTKSVVGEEKTWNDGGGGFSATFAIPEWQTKVVAGYKDLAKQQGVLPAANLFNDTGRGYPDVAALAGLVNPYCVFAGGKGQAIGVGGTSASSPTVAGIFAQLNEVRLAAGKPTLGPLNQLLYSFNGQGFNDVTKGKNNGEGEQGFTALKGWDPATGWGTPDYSVLKKLVTSMYE